MYVSNKSFASFTRNKVLGKIDESSLIMATFPPRSSFVSVLASWYQASPPTEAIIRCYVHMIAL
jgi:hypothetical protein